MKGVAVCRVTSGDRTVPVRFHILPGSCPPILDGNSAVHLGVISVQGKSGSDNIVYSTISMVHTDQTAEEEEGKQFSATLNNLLTKYSTNLNGLEIK